MKVKTRKPSRILNERSVLMGLDFTDLTGLALAMALFQICLKPFHLEFFALVLSIALGVVLSPIRMNFRRKILRDSVQYVFGPRQIGRRKKK